ncbi:MAG TPA: VOC family protein [Pyrinomonadaceae bacterium]|jgi:uncharacterized glyoxalase superfamily protein PhnB|nr:VOC family protein [Pyrinomonadaceae bacterium]
MPRFNQAAPTFLVNDVEGTVRWYEKQLGFTVYPHPKDPPHVFASICRDGVEIMFQRADGYRKPDLYEARPGGVWDAYIRIQGIAELYEALKDRVEIKMPLSRQPYGDSEFEVKDPNGYILVFSEQID